MLQGEAGLTVSFYLRYAHVVKLLKSPGHQKFGKRIQQLRKQRGLTQEDLADLIGVDRSYMGFVERGERNPTLDKIIKIAKALKMTLSEIFSGI